MLDTMLPARLTQRWVLVIGLRSENTMENHITHRVSFALVIVVGTVIASALSTNAQLRTRDSLRGLSAVPVKVQVSKGAGTTPDRLLEFVELRLRRSGIVVPENNSPALRDGHAVLWVDVTSSEDGAYLLEVNLRLTQDVTLKRRPSLEAHVATWEQSLSGGDQKSTEPNVRRRVSDLLDSFINDYLAVNQK